MTHVAFTGEHLAQAAAITATQTARESGAVNRLGEAIDNLAQGRFGYDGKQVTIRVAPDATAPVEKTYYVTTVMPFRCTCNRPLKRGRWCWHMTATKIITLAAELAASGAEVPREAGPLRKELQALGDLPRPLDAQPE